MSHISILQPEEVAASLGSIALPDSFVALKVAAASSELLSQELQNFLEREGYETLKQLRGSAAAEVADFLDTVRGLCSTTILSRDQPTHL